MVMYGRLRAEESLATVAAHLAGDPWTNAQAATQIVAGWQRALPREPVKHERLTPEQFYERMRAHGLELVH